MSRLTEADKKFGPIVYGPTTWRAWRFVYSSGGGEENYPRNHITIYALGFVARIPMPSILRPLKIKVEANWDAETIARLGRNYYFNVYEREYGVSLSDGGFLQLFFGPQSINDSSLGHNRCCHLPWTQWRHIRKSLYDDKGKLFYTQWDRRGKFRDSWSVASAIDDLCPTKEFYFLDYDGATIVATTHIEEREWRFGTSYFKWLSLFRARKIRRSLDLKFSQEVGPEKGSWKGGTLGHGIEMLAGEDHEAAFKRYCTQEHRAKHRKFAITYVGVKERPMKNDPNCSAAVSKD